MGIAILAIMGCVAACGVFGFLMLTRGHRQHPRHIRGVRRYDAAQTGALWGGDSGGWAGHSAGHSGFGGFDGGGGGGCGDGGGGGGSC
jgi:hypothetical protein